MQGSSAELVSATRSCRTRQHTEACTHTLLVWCRTCAVAMETAGREVMVVNK